MASSILHQMWEQLSRFFEKTRDKFRYLTHFVPDNKIGGYRCRSQVPEHEILKIVRMYEPIITEFFDNIVTICPPIDPARAEVS